MNLWISADIRDLMTRTMTCLETTNAMSHNETTWEKKQEIITIGLQILRDCLNTATEAVDVVEVMEIAKKAQGIASPRQI